MYYLSVGIEKKYSQNAGVLLIVLSLVLSGFILVGIDQRWILKFITWPLLILGVSILDIKGNDIITKASDISFDVYVWHYPLMVFVQLVCAILKLNIKHTYFTMLLFLILSWDISFVSWRYIDVPIRNRLRKLDGKYGKR